MMNQLDFPRPLKNSPNWGVIIVTGIAAALVMVFAGILIKQVSHVLEAAPAEDTAVPTPSPTVLDEPPAAYALQVQHEGRWVMRVTITSPGFEPRVYESQGEGTEVTLPFYQATTQDTVTVEGEFTVYVTYPVFDGTGRTQTGSRRYGSHGEYIDAMNMPHYMLYDENNNFLFIRDAEEMRQHYQGLPVSAWQP